MVLGIILLGFTVYSPELYYYFFLLDSLRNKENVVIAIIGERYPIELGHEEGENWQILEELYKKIWYNLTHTLAEKWEVGISFLLWRRISI